MLFIVAVVVVVVVVVVVIVVVVVVHGLVFRRAHYQKDICIWELQGGAVVVWLFLEELIFGGDSHDGISGEPNSTYGNIAKEIKPEILSGNDQTNEN